MSLAGKFFLFVGKENLLTGEIVEQVDQFTVLVKIDTCEHIPPSHNMILYVIAAGGAISVADLFTAGIIPGLVMMLSLMVVAWLVAVKRGYPSEAFPGWGVGPAFSTAPGAGSWALSGSLLLHRGNCSRSWPRNTAFTVWQSTDGLFARNSALCFCQGHSTDSSASAQAMTLTSKNARAI
jgi:hypothetical protein